MPFAFAKPSFTCCEADGAVAVEVVWTGDSSEKRQVSFRTEDGTAVQGKHYSAASGTLLFPPGITSDVIEIAILNCPDYDPFTSFTIQLLDRRDVIGEATVEILDNVSATALLARKLQHSVYYTVLTTASMVFSIIIPQIQTLYIKKDHDQTLNTVYICCTLLSVFDVFLNSYVSRWLYIGGSSMWMDLVAIVGNCILIDSDKFGWRLAISEVMDPNKYYHRRVALDEWGHIARTMKLGSLIGRFSGILIQATNFIGTWVKRLFKKAGAKKKSRASTGGSDVEDAPAVEEEDDAVDEAIDDAQAEASKQTRRLVVSVVEGLVSRVVLTITVVLVLYINLAANEDPDEMFKGLIGITMSKTWDPTSANPVFGYQQTSMYVGLMFLFGQPAMPAFDPTMNLASLEKFFNMPFFGKGDGTNLVYLRVGGEIEEDYTNMDEAMSLRDNGEMRLVGINEYDEPMLRYNGSGDYPSKEEIEAQNSLNCLYKEGSVYPLNDEIGGMEELFYNPDYFSNYTYGFEFHLWLNGELPADLNGQLRNIPKPEPYKEGDNVTEWKRRNLETFVSNDIFFTHVPQTIQNILNSPTRPGGSMSLNPDGTEGEPVDAPQCPVFRKCMLNTHKGAEWSVQYDCTVSAAVFDNRETMRRMARARLYVSLGMVVSVLIAAVLIVMDLLAKILNPILRIASAAKKLKDQSKVIQGALDAVAAGDYDETPGDEGGESKAGKLGGKGGLSFKGGGDGEGGLTEKETVALVQCATGRGPLGTATEQADGVINLFQAIYNGPISTMLTALYDVESTLGVSTSASTSLIVSAKAALANRWPVMRSIAGGVDDGTLTSNELIDDVELLLPSLPAAITNQEETVPAIKMVASAARAVGSTAGSAARAGIQQIERVISSDMGLGDGQQVTFADVKQWAPARVRPLVRAALAAASQPIPADLDTMGLKEMAAALGEGGRIALKDHLARLGVVVSPEAFANKHPRDVLLAVEAALIPALTQRAEAAGFTVPQALKDAKGILELRIAAEMEALQKLSAKAESDLGLSLPPMARLREVKWGAAVAMINKLASEAAGPPESATAEAAGAAARARAAVADVLLEVGRAVESKAASTGRQLLIHKDVQGSIIRAFTAAMEDPKELAAQAGESAAVQRALAAAAAAKAKLDSGVALAIPEVQMLLASAKGGEGGAAGAAGARAMAVLRAAVAALAERAEGVDVEAIKDRAAAGALAAKDKASELAAGVDVEAMKDRAAAGAASLKENAVSPVGFLKAVARKLPQELGNGDFAAAAEERVRALVAQLEALLRGLPGVPALRGPGGADLQVPRTLGEAVDTLRALAPGGGGAGPGEGSGWVLMSMLQPLEKLQEVAASVLESQSLIEPGAGLAGLANAAPRALAAIQSQIQRAVDELRARLQVLLDDLTRGAGGGSVRIELPGRVGEMGGMGGSGVIPVIE